MKPSFLLVLVAFAGLAHAQPATKPASKADAKAVAPAAAPARLGSSKFVRAVPLNPGGEFSQRFRVSRPGLKGVTFPVATYGRTPSSYKVEWAIVAMGKTPRELGRGTIDAATLKDWATVAVPAAVARADETEFVLSLNVPKGSAVAAPIGVALFDREEAGSPVVSPAGGSGPVMGLSVTF